MQQADFLLIDLGNTTAKLRLARRSLLVGKTCRVPTVELLSGDGIGVLTEAIAGWNYDRAVFSSVVPGATYIVEKVISADKMLRVSPELDTGVDLRGYPGTATLGADRIANMAGALALYGPGPLIIVDFGTAATFNVLDAKGRFLGGVIAPGLAALRDYLPARGAQLPPIDLRRPLRAAIGRDTKGAILAGVVLGFRGMVREILDGLQAELGGRRRARVIATGGDAAWVSRQLPDMFGAVDPDLTLHGLRVIGARQF